MIIYAGRKGERGWCCTWLEMNLPTIFQKSGLSVPDYMLLL